jgi:hypothetical protein
VARSPCVGRRRHVQVRFEAACVGCPLRPVTTQPDRRARAGRGRRGRVGQRGRGTGQPPRRRPATGGVRRPPGGWNDQRAKEQAMADGVVEGKLAELGLELPKKMPAPAATTSAR